MSDNTPKFDFNAAADQYDEDQRVAAERRRQRTEEASRREKEAFERNWAEAFKQVSSKMRKRVQRIYESEHLSYTDKIALLRKLLDNSSTTTSAAANTGSNAELEAANRRIIELTDELAQARTDADAAAAEQRRKYERLERESNLAMNALMELANQAGLDVPEFEVTKAAVDQVVQATINGFKTKFQSTTTNSNGGNSADQQLLMDLESKIRAAMQSIAAEAGVQVDSLNGQINITRTAEAIVAKVKAMKTGRTQARRLTAQLLQAHANSERARTAFGGIDPNAEANKLSKTAKTVVKKLKGSGTSGVITYATAEQVEVLDTSMNKEEGLMKDIQAELTK